MACSQSVRRGSRLFLHGAAVFVLSIRKVPVPLLYSPCAMLKSFREFAARAAAPLRPSSAACSPAETAPAASDASSELMPPAFLQYYVMGFDSCPWFWRARLIAEEASEDEQVAAQGETVWCMPMLSERAQFGQGLRQLAETVPEAKGHNSCPAIVSLQCRRRPEFAKETTPIAQPDMSQYSCKTAFVGGYTELEKDLFTRFGFKSVKAEQLKRLDAMGGNAGGCPTPDQKE